LAESGRTVFLNPVVELRKTFLVVAGKNGLLAVSKKERTRYVTLTSSSGCTEKMRILED
jgi:hypothetical protein